MPLESPSQRPGMIDTFHREFGNRDSDEIAPCYKTESSAQHRHAAREPNHTASSSRQADTDIFYALAVPSIDSVRGKSPAVQLVP